MAEFPSIEEMAKKVAETALDRFKYQGKTIREWIKIITEQDWIPVTEMLPENDTRVLITTTSALGTERIVLEVSYLNGVFIRGFSSYTPSAWMPLPEPYKEVSKA